MKREKTVVVTVKMSESEIRSIDEKADRANMTRSEYLRNAAKGNVISYVENSKEILHYIMETTKCVDQIQRKHSNINLQELRERGYDLCRILSLSINKETT